MRLEVVGETPSFRRVASISGREERVSGCTKDLQESGLVEDVEIILQYSRGLAKQPAPALL